MRDSIFNIGIDLHGHKYAGQKERVLTRSV